jgi:hypothetical protein
MTTMVAKLFESRSAAQIYIFQFIFRLSFIEQYIHLFLYIHKIH